MNSVMHFVVFALMVKVPVDHWSLFPGDLPKSSAIHFHCCMDEGIQVAISELSSLVKEWKFPAFSEHNSIQLDVATTFTLLSLFSGDGEVMPLVHRPHSMKRQLTEL